jgi:selenocysteine lyase/cysteine desulfurase
MLEFHLDWVDPAGWCVRGLVHYNTLEEINKFGEELGRIAANIQ